MLDHPHAPPSRRRAVAAATLLTTLLVVAGCSSSGSDEGSTKTKVAPPATAERTTTTAAPPTTAAVTTTLAATPTGGASPEAAAQALYDAWKVGDKGAASKVATPTAVDGIWATAPGDYAVYNKCDTGEFSTSGCLFRGMGGTIQFTMERQPSGFVVIEALFSPP